ncbi:MAG: ankyrin repeat domain-containing protein [Candidatus Dependentiae bacterium]|nr:ankyrin repeat domain-containing protein [Candidatus Dependentiae bacterium]
MKKILLYSTLWLLLFLGIPIFSSAPAMSSAQDDAIFKCLTREQEERFFTALSDDDTDVISAFNPAIVDENAYEFTKAAIINHKASFFNYFLSKLSPAKVHTKNDDNHSLLHVAAEVGNADAVEKLLKKGLSARDKTVTTGQNPLHLAYAFNPVIDQDFDPRVIQHLVSDNPNIINEPDGNGKTALHHAVLRDNPDMLQELLSHKPNIKIKDQNGYTALDYAISTKNLPAFEMMDITNNICDPSSKKFIIKLMSGSQYDLDPKQPLKLKRQFSPEFLNNVLFNIGADTGGSLVSLLIENGANPNINNNTEQTPLHAATKQGNVEAVRALLAAKANPNATDIEGFNPLHAATQKGSVEIMRLLLAAGVNPNIANKKGLTPLLIAVSAGRIEAVNALLDTGANPNISNDVGVTPLHQAAFQGLLEIAKTLLDAKADPNTVIANGRTPLYEAVSKGRIKIVRALLDKGANPSPDHEKGGYVSLHVAIEQGDNEIIRALLDKGANPNITDWSSYNTPLYIAVKKENLEIVRALLSKGANSNIKTKYHYYPLVVAVEKRNVAIVRALLDNGAHVNIEVEPNTSFGHTLLSRARRDNSSTPEIIELLESHTSYASQYCVVQ